MILQREGIPNLLEIKNVIFRYFVDEKNRCLAGKRHAS